MMHLLCFTWMMMTKLKTENHRYRKVVCIKNFHLHLKDQLGQTMHQGKIPNLKRVDRLRCHTKLEVLKVGQRMTVVKIVRGVNLRLKEAIGKEKTKEVKKNQNIRRLRLCSN